MTLFTDRVTAGIESALDSVSLRQRVTADNIANMNTPGFKAARVEFEANLARALQGGGAPGQARAEVTAATTPASADGNTVNVAEEQAIMVKAGLHFEALVTALNFKYSTLRTAITGR